VSLEPPVGKSQFRFVLGLGGVLLAVGIALSLVFSTTAYFGIAAGIWALWVVYLVMRARRRGGPSPHSAEVHESGATLAELRC
jgi:hypothetical protein